MPWRPPGQWTRFSSGLSISIEHMPELSWTFGYPFALALMVVATGTLWVWFKKSGWL